MATSRKKRRTRRAAPTIEARKGSKMAIAIPIVENYLEHQDEQEPGEVVEELMKKANLSQAGARTYLYNIKNRLQS